MYDILCITYYIYVCVCFCVFNENSKILNVIWILNGLSDQQCGETTQETLVKKFLLFFFYYDKIQTKHIHIKRERIKNRWKEFQDKVSKLQVNETNLAQTAIAQYEEKLIMLASAFTEKGKQKVSGERYVSHVSESYDVVLIKQDTKILHFRE